MVEIITLNSVNGMSKPFLRLESRPKMREANLMLRMLLLRSSCLPMKKPTDENIKKIEFGLNNRQIEDV